MSEAAKKTKNRSTIVIQSISKKYENCTNTKILLKMFVRKMARFEKVQKPEQLGIQNNLSTTEQNLLDNLPFFQN